jgi:hypothetical protein
MVQSTSTFTSINVPADGNSADITGDKMKQKFRKGKPPLRIQEKGDANRKPYKKKLIKGRSGQFLTMKGWRDPTAEEKRRFEEEAQKSANELAKKIIAIQHGQPVTIKTGEHTGETAVVIGPSKTLPGRLGVLTLGGLVHYKPEDLEVQK